MYSHDSFFEPKLGNRDIDTSYDYILPHEDHLPHLIHADYVEEQGKEATAKHIREVTEKNNLGPTFPLTANTHRIWIDKGIKGILKPKLSTHIIQDYDYGDKADVEVVHWFSPKDKAPIGISYIKKFPTYKKAKEHYDTLRSEIPDTYDSTDSENYPEIYSRYLRGQQ